jgi:hypothetical protein
MRDRIRLCIIARKAGAATVEPRAPIVQTSGCVSTRLFDEVDMSYVLHNWIFVGSNAYDEYTFVPWLNKNVYRRTVDLCRVCLQ